MISRFLRLSEYSNHPYTQEWTKLLGNLRKQRKVDLAALIKHLKHEVVTIRRQEWRDDKNHVCRVYRIQ